MVSALLIAGERMDDRPGDDLPGLLAFIVVAFLVVAGIVLYRSMRRQIGRISIDDSPAAPEHADEAEPPR